MSFWDALFSTTESHRDGSSTERLSDGTAITRESNGSLREKATPTTVMGIPVVVTTDAAGRTTNVQDRKAR